ncbi:hypothetical protein GCM10011414_29410 [Croceivirga lutea]|uniref:BLUF domain-containing protein n=1 Tax=Croceivirga lutea TaxID=1775167 RepID=UPI001639E83E|nr:BLUF domain-containing protein [Croceivirga lutea]GGG57690.1 hypothetical protein GCM10011414_29410 [Croceivirga lutea]
MSGVIESYIFLSTEKQHFNTELLQNLVARSSSMNKRYGITGFMYQTQPYFFGYVEGTSKNIAQLKTNLNSDTRHKVIYWLNDKEKQKRRFKSWDLVKKENYNDKDADTSSSIFLLLDVLVLSINTFIRNQVQVSGTKQREVFEKIDRLANLFELIKQNELHS